MCLFEMRINSFTRPSVSPSVQPSIHPSNPTIHLSKLCSTNLESASGDFGSVERVAAIFGRLPGVELGIADRLAGQSVDFDERAEPAKRVLENGRGQSPRRADDEQTSFVIAVPSIALLRHCESTNSTFYNKRMWQIFTM